MSKKKYKVASYQVALNELQKKMLEEMMLEDAQTNTSAFFGFVLVQEYKHRQELKNKRPQGRPKKEDDNGEADPYADDLPKNIPHGDKMIGKQEQADLEEIRRAIFAPK